MKRILLTGGAGFIGSNLTKELLYDGLYHITCIDNFDPFYPKKQKELNVASFLDNDNYVFIEGDIRKQEDLEKICNIDIIIHLAAKAGVRPSIENPFLYQDVNIAGTQNLLEYAKRKGIKQFVFASSSSVYGTNVNVPWNENEKLFPISPYACSKLSDEMLGHVYMHLYKIRFLSLRFFTVYGPAQRPDLAIYKFFDLISKGLPVPVFGDGNSARDYTFVSDIIAGIKSAIEYKLSDFEIINLGNNTSIKLKDLIIAIEITCGKTAIIDRHPEQPGDVIRTFADISKAKRLLNYSPAISLETGLEIFFKWFCNPMECELENKFDGV